MGCLPWSGYLQWDQFSCRLVYQKIWPFSQSQFYKNTVLTVGNVTLIELYFASQKFVKFFGFNFASQGFEKFRVDLISQMSLKIFENSIFFGHKNGEF